MDPKHRSHLITDGRDRAGARAMFKAIGFSNEDLKKPIIGVANTWIETMPCNFHLRRLSAKVKEGIRSAGGTPGATGSLVQGEEALSLEPPGSLDGGLYNRFSIQEENSFSCCAR